MARIRVAPFDETRFATCGRDNVRLWRLKDGQLRSAPVNLGDYHSLHLTDCCYDGDLGISPLRTDRLL